MRHQPFYIFQWLDCFLNQRFFNVQLTKFFTSHDQRSSTFPSALSATVHCNSSISYWSKNSYWLHSYWDMLSLVKVSAYWWEVDWTQAAHCEWKSSHSAPSDFAFPLTMTQRSGLQRKLPSVHTIHCPHRGRKKPHIQDKTLKESHHLL